MLQAGITASPSGLGVSAGARYRSPAALWMPAASRQCRGEDAQHIFTAGGAASVDASPVPRPVSQHRGNLMASGTFRGMNHYRFYELDHSEHIEAGYSVE